MGSTVAADNPVVLVAVWSRVMELVMAVVVWLVAVWSRVLVFLVAGAVAVAVAVTVTVAAFRERVVDVVIYELSMFFFFRKLFCVGFSSLRSLCQ